MVKLKYCPECENQLTYDEEEYQWFCQNEFCAYIEYEDEEDDDDDEE